jgi:cyclase
MISGHGNIPIWETGLKKLTNNIFAYLHETGSFGLSNAGFILTNDYSILIDTFMSESMTLRLLNEIKAVTSKKIKYLINTHSHGDHLLGNHLISDAITICHDNCRRDLIENGEPLLHLMKETHPDFDFVGALCTPQEVTFSTKLIIHCDRKEIHLLHYGKAHTDGDIFVYVPDQGIVFCGDILFLYSTPAGAKAYFESWINVLTRIADLNADIFVPGHGPVCDKQGLYKCRDYLTLIYEKAKKAYREGDSAITAAKKINLGEFEKWVEHERLFINIDRIYRELKGEEPISPLDQGTIKQLLATDNNIK